MFKLSKKLLSTSLVVGLLASSVVTSFATPNNNEKEYRNLLNTMNVNRSYQHVKVLSEDIGPRVGGSEQEYQAAQYIAKEFEKLGMEVEIQPFTFTRAGVQKTSWNVEAVRKPKEHPNKVDPADKDEIVYVTAHYDSVLNSPGANDNASGTAVMLEIAKSMNNMDIDREVRFVACGSEEMGLQGASAYVASLTAEEKSKSVGSFNLDMVATAYEPCTELGVYTFNGAENVVTDAVKEAGYRLNQYTRSSVSYDGEHERKPDGELVAMNSSDHVPFQKADIPAVLFINVDPAKKDSPRSAIEPYYHKPEDNLSNLSVERLERTVKLVGSAVYDLVDLD